MIKHRNVTAVPGPSVYFDNFKVFFLPVNYYYYIQYTYYFITYIYRCCLQILILNNYFSRSCK